MSIFSWGPWGTPSIGVKNSQTCNTSHGTYIIETKIEDKENNRRETYEERTQAYAQCIFRGMDMCWLKHVLYILGCCPAGSHHCLGFEKYTYSNSLYNTSCSSSLSPFTCIYMCFRIERCNVHLAMKLNICICLDQQLYHISVSFSRCTEDCTLTPLFDEEMKAH